MFDIHFAVHAVSRAFFKAGSNMATSIAIMEITTSNSMSVKAECERECVMAPVLDSPEDLSQIEVVNGLVVGKIGNVFENMFSGIKLGM